MLLLAGFFEEFIGRADAQHFSRVETVIDGPFDNGRAEPADDAMLFHRDHKFEPCPMSRSGSHSSSGFTV